MNPAISVLIPLHNAEATVGPILQDIMEIVADLDNDFEVVLVDDGSTDDTAQHLVDLARRFPQVTAISSRRRRGFVEAVQAGLELISGSTVFIQDGAARPSPDAYRMLWHQRHETSPAATPPRTADLGDSWLGRLVHWGTQISGGVCRVDVPSGLQMLHRRTSRAPGNWAKRLLRTDLGVPGALFPSGAAIDAPQTSASSR